MEVKQIFAQAAQNLAALQASLRRLETTIRPSTKAALLIGINYAETPSELKGCVNDVRNVERVLLDVYHFKPENVLCLTDAPDKTKTTRASILGGIRWLVRKNREGCSSLWFHYSGHGTHVADASRDERDGRDECIVPSDFRLVTDDVLFAELVAPLETGTRLVGFMDCCHSGSQLDLKYRYVAGNRNAVENRRQTSKATALILSGCKDPQTSADAFFKDDGWAGAMTKYLLEVLREADYNVTCYTLLRKLRAKLRAQQYTQTPQLTCSARVSGATIFSANDEPGVDAYIST
jgi:hypothetical protein